MTTSFFTASLSLRAVGVGTRLRVLVDGLVAIFASRALRVEDLVLRVVTGGAGFSVVLWVFPPLRGGAVVVVAVVVLAAMASRGKCEDGGIPRRQRYI